MGKQTKIRMGGKLGSAVGLEYDFTGIRAARIAPAADGDFRVEALEELRGEFGKDEYLVEGLRKVREKLRLGSRERVVSCLSGKQIYAAQLSFRNLPEAEMAAALKIEVRKTLHFEVSGASLEYQILSQSAVKGEQNQVLVSVVANLLINRQLRDMEKAGIRPDIADVLPMAVANALWHAVEPGKSELPWVAVHVGPQVCHIVIDGAKSPFFHRSVYFSTEEMFGANRDQVADRERERRVQGLGEEIARSLAFYSKNCFVSGFNGLLALGNYLDEDRLLEAIGKSAGLTARRMDLIAGKLKNGSAPAGKFDLALSLALRGLE